MTKVLITGGAGFIGSNFVFHMLENHPDYELVVVDLLTYAGNLETLKDVLDRPNVHFYKADIADREAIFELFENERPDTVVNFAAESHVDRSIEDPGIFLRSNIIGTQTLMDACPPNTGSDAIIRSLQTRCTAICRSTVQTCFSQQETPLHASSPYSASKASADLLVQAYHRTYGLPDHDLALLEQLRALPFPGEADPAHHFAGACRMKACRCTERAETCATGCMCATIAQPSTVSSTTGRVGEVV